MIPRAAVAFGVAVVYAGVGASGCRSEDEERDRPSLAVPKGVPRGGGPPSAVSTGANVLAAARCAREAACGRVGEGARWPDVELCVRRALVAHADDVALVACAGTIDPFALDACAQRLAMVPCDRPDPSSRDLCGAEPLCRGAARP